MNYALPVALVTLVSLGVAFELVQKGSVVGSAPDATLGADPPWVSGAWQPQPLDAEPAAGLTDGSDPHAGLFGHAPSANAAGDDEPPSDMGSCPRVDDAAHTDLSSGVHASGGDPHVQAYEQTVDVRIPRSTAHNGHTVAEIFADRSALREQSVRVRGMVVKRTDGILGKSFLHLQDGSGSVEQANADLTLTTTEDIALGEVVEVEGRLQLDQDLGVGYRYPALLASATRVRAIAGR